MAWERQPPRVAPTLMVPKKRIHAMSSLLQPELAKRMTGHLLTEPISLHPEQKSSIKSAEGVHNQEMMPAHSVCAAEKSGVGPKDGDKPPKNTILPPCNKNKYWPTLSRNSFSRTYFPYRTISAIAMSVLARKRLQMRHRE